MYDNNIRTDSEIHHFINSEFRNDRLRLEWPLAVNTENNDELTTLPSIIPCSLVYDVTIMPSEFCPNTINNGRSRLRIDRPALLCYHTTSCSIYLPPAPVRADEQVVHNI